MFQRGRKGHLFAPAGLAGGTGTMCPQNDPVDMGAASHNSVAAKFLSPRADNIILLVPVILVGLEDSYKN